MEKEANSNGNCYVVEDDLIAGVEKLLDIEIKDRKETLESLIVNGIIAIDDTGDENRVYLPQIEKSEMRCAMNIANILNSEIEDEFDVKYELSKLESEHLDELQIEAIKKSMTEKMLIITGDLVQGKQRLSTILREFSRIMIRI